MGIFKSYDIRGLCPEEIDEEISRKIGAATARFLKAKKLIVGWDMRPTSIGLRDAFIEGANREGCACLDVGMVTTPLTYWAVKHFQADGSVMITASHNPAEYNGMKICGPGPVALSYDEGLSEIEKIVCDPHFVFGSSQATNDTVDPWKEYQTHILSFQKNWKPLTVVVDAGNGMGGVGVDKVFENYNGQLIKLFFEPDGSFPNHEANPLKAECVRDLQDKVKEVGADLGVALDGDADRCAFVDEKGEVVPCDLVTALFAEQFLTQEPGGGVIYDLRSSHIVPERVRALGGTPHRDRVGHSHMKKTLRETGSIFGGELSGHYYFRDHACSDSGLLAFVIMLNLLSSTSQPLSELIEPLKVYWQSGEINFHIEDKDGMIETLSKKYASGKQDTLDGLTVEFDDWWFNVRKSNTEPMLRLNLEAQNQEIGSKKVVEIKNFLENSQVASGS